MIAAIVLAAGFARRMGRQKLLLELRGKSVVRWSVEAILPHVGDILRGLHQVLDLPDLLTHEGLFYTRRA